MLRTHQWFEEVHQHAESVPLCGGLTMAYSCRSPARETPNEDAAMLVEIGSDQGILAVADGVGGANAGNRAARAVIESLADTISRQAASLSDSDLTGNAATFRGAILDGIEAANREVLSWGIGAASTLVVAEYCSGEARIVHVGDAVGLVFSSHGQIRYSTVAHAPVAMAVELGIIDEDEALLHEDRHLILNCIGSPEMKIELGPPVKMAKRDTLVLGSDGMFDNLTTDTVVEHARKGDLQSGVEQLLEMTRQRMDTPDLLPSKPDDLTVLFFRPSARPPEMLPPARSSHTVNK